MSIPATIADIPFLSAAPDWNAKPSWKRNWIGDIAAALFGAEQRAAMRSRGLVTLGYRVTPYTTEDRAQAEAVWRAALKAARIAIPYWTHGAELAADIASNSSLLILNSSLYTFRAGDFLWLPNGENGGQASRVTAVNNDGSLSLVSNTAFALSAGDLIWPVVFGIPKPGADNSGDSPARLLLEVTVTDIDEQLALKDFYLSAPAILDPPAGGTATSFGGLVSWTPVADATGYRVEVFAGAVCGGTAIHSQTLDVSKPALLDPPADGQGTLTSYGARISWTPVAKSAGYRIEIFNGDSCGGTAIHTAEVSA